MNKRKIQKLSKQQFNILNVYTCINDLTTLKNNFSVIKSSISPWGFAGITYFKCHIMTIFSFLIFQLTLLKRIRINTIFRKLNNKPDWKTNGIIRSSFFAFFQDSQPSVTSLIHRLGVALQVICLSERSQVFKAVI